MSRILKPAIAVAAALLLGNAAPDDSGFICVSGGRWSPSLEDAAAIEAVPVPVGYRAKFESTAPCERWSMDEASLVDWHLGFGTERSASAALFYLERDYLSRLPRPERYRIELDRAWRSALPSLNRAKALRQSEGASYSIAHRFLEKDRLAQELRTLLQAYDGYVFLAEQHLRAAEEFGSTPLLRKADQYLLAAVEGADFLEPLESEEPGAGLVHFNLKRFRTDDLRMRSAILSARLGRSEAALSRAEALLQSAEGPHYRGLAEAAYSGGSGFCDVGSDGSDSEALRNACEADDESKEKVTHYWINRAMLDWLSEANERRSDELAFRLLEREKLSESGRCCRRSADEDLLRLWSQRADHHRRRLAKAAAAQDDGEIGRNWGEALDDLQKSERLAPITSTPARFGRIARAWLEIWQSGPALFDGRGHLEGMTKSPDRRRYAAYLRRLLGAVDSIAAGDDAGPSPGRISADRPQ